VDPDRYDLTLNVLKAGVKTVSATAVIYEDYDASVAESGITFCYNTVRLRLHNATLILTENAKA